MTPLKTRIVRLANAFSDKIFEIHGGAQRTDEHRYLRFCWINEPADKFVVEYPGPSPDKHYRRCWWSIDEVQSFQNGKYTNNIRPFWNWLYFDGGKRELGENDAFTVLSDEILCDGVLSYKHSEYLQDSPYLIRDKILFVLGSTGKFDAATHSLTYHISFVSTLRLDKSLLGFSPNSKSTFLSAWR